jgi:hypothetical protein
MNLGNMFNYSLLVVVLVSCCTEAMQREIPRMGGRTALAASPSAFRSLHTPSCIAASARCPPMLSLPTLREEQNG